MVSGRTCPICTAGTPSNVIAELGCCWLTMEVDTAPALPGTCALFLKRHAVDLHGLSIEEGAEFMATVQKVSRLLAKASDAVKINYEVHGNTIPHLHMHFFPRYRGDPFENGPINPRVKGTAQDLERHVAIRTLLIEKLGKDQQNETEDLS